ncbi:DinB family protein [Cytobacillus sp. FJAT-54145]|uniref:DinB family protein n=1 Tax=Cytobacillus spartinae TaxID=3299023 RepID=A0ABW6K8H3_9BACI
MDKSGLFLIGPVEGHGTEFSKLITMMNFTRITTLEEVKNLTIDELDFQFDEEANTIGMLLSHLVAVERGYQIETFQGRYVSKEEIEELNPSLQLGKDAHCIRGNHIKFYLNELHMVRQQTLETFKTLPDEWLFIESPFWGGKMANNYFKWFHVFEDELNHRGQIRLIKKMYQRQKTVNL